MRFLILGLVLSALSAFCDDSERLAAKEVLDAARDYRNTKDATVLDRILVAYTKHPEMDAIVIKMVPVDAHTMPVLIKLIQVAHSNTKLRRVVYVKLGSGPESAEVVRLWRKSLLDPKEDSDVRFTCIGLLGEVKWASAHSALLEAFEQIGEQTVHFNGRDTREMWRDRILSNLINGKCLEMSEKLLAAYPRVYPGENASLAWHQQRVQSLRGEVAQRKAVEMKKINTAIVTVLLCAVSAAAIWLLFRPTAANPGKSPVKPPPLPS